LTRQWLNYGVSCGTAGTLQAELAVGVAGSQVLGKLDEGSRSMNDRTAQLSSRILELIKDEPFEDVVAMLGTIQIFLLINQVDEPVLGVDRLSRFMRTEVREQVKQAERDPAHRTPGHRGTVVGALRENTILERFLDVWRCFSRAK